MEGSLKEERLEVLREFADAVDYGGAETVAMY